MSDAFRKRIDSAREYWAFRPLADPQPPPSSSSWVRTPIDAFILDKLAAKDLEPSEPLERERLLRRVFLDLTGLPPTPDEAERFLQDASPRAYEDLVERLIASPHYGERWALKWLDVVRYSDTDGFERDGFRTDAWRYRDYVVDAFNEGKPYDRFVQEQIAGDLLFPGDAEALIATGFLGMGPRHVVGGNQDKEESRQEVLTEMTQGVGSVFLGLTVQCARCHDHKFDPIAQADYYRLQAFFAATEIDEPNLAPVDELTAYAEAVEAHEQRLAPIKKQLAEMEKPFRERAQAIKRAKLEAQFVRALEKPKERRSEDEQRMAEEAEKQIKPAWYEMLALIPADVKAERAALRARMHAIELEAPEPPVGAYAVARLEQPEPTHILKIGDYRHKLDRVDPGYPFVLADEDETPSDPRGRRAALARWLTGEAAPLTARVMANRIWQLRMGRGLVADPNNFGLLGGGASHPELLDFLARRLIETGWDVQAVDRMIVLSNVYRQASEHRPDAAEADAENKLWHRAEKRRLAAELIRDNVLAVSGRLTRDVGGRPVRIPIEQEVYDLIFTEGEPDNLWPVTPDESEHRRRAIYLLNRRTVRLPMLANFDQPDTMTSCAVRPESTHALQALTLLNSDFMQAESRAFAERLAAACGEDDGCAVEESYRVALARSPTPEEKRSALEFLAAPDARLSDYCLAMLNRNELVYRP